MIHALMPSHVVKIYHRYACVAGMDGVRGERSVLEMPIWCRINSDEVMGA